MKETRDFKRQKTGDRQCKGTDPGDGVIYVINSKWATRAGLQNIGRRVMYKVGRVEKARLPRALNVKQFTSDPRGNGEPTENI